MVEERPWERRRREAQAAAPPCDLDSAEFNLCSAFWAPPNEYFPSGWRAMKHGVPVNREHLLACGCPLCMEGYEKLVRWAAPPVRPPEPEPVEPPRKVDVGPVRAHVLELLDTMSRGEVAVAAGVDVTTIARLLRPDVRQVTVETAEAVLAVAA